VLFEGAILDGRNRYRACVAAAIDARFEIYDGPDPLAYVVSLNLKRRHLDESQRGMVAAKIATLSDGVRSDRQGAQICAPTQEAAGSMLNISRRTVQYAREVLNEGIPELVAKVDRGEVSVTAAADLAGLPQTEQREIVARVERFQRMLRQTITSKMIPIVIARTELMTQILSAFDNVIC
jgi:hypothetical protein